MSIEKALADLTAAVEKNNELLTILTSKAQAGVAAKTTEPASTASAATTTAPDEAPKRGRGRPAKDADPKPVKALTSEQVYEQTKTFLDVENDEEYQARKDLVKKIVEKFGVKKMSEVAEGDRAAALNYLALHKAGEATGLEDEDDLA